MFNYILKSKAVSLIEIIVTITIVLILSTISLYSYQDYKVKAQFNGAFSTAEQNKLAIIGYYAKNKKCPQPGFINPAGQSSQTINNAQCTTSSSTSCVNNITNNGCTLNLNDANGNTIISLQAALSPMGDLQYFCILGATNAPPDKYLSITCNPNDFTMPSATTPATINGVVYTSP